MSRAIDYGAMFAAGLFAWTLIEYAIHGWVGHLIAASAPMHLVHHTDPWRVFAIRTWIPIGVVLIACVALWGITPATMVVFGILAGMVVYEGLHYRIHFAQPRGRLEGYLRERHLVHHYRAPKRCFGVTSALWDWVFRSGVEKNEMRQLRASVRDVPPIAGRSNLGYLVRGRLPWSLSRSR